MRILLQMYEWRVLFPTKNQKFEPKVKNFERSYHHKVTNFLTEEDSFYVSFSLYPLFTIALNTMRIKWTSILVCEKTSFLLWINWLEFFTANHSKLFNFFWKKNVNAEFHLQEKNDNALPKRESSHPRIKFWLYLAAQRFINLHVASHLYFPCQNEKN